MDVWGHDGLSGEDHCIEKCGDWRATYDHAVWAAKSWVEVAGSEQDHAVSLALTSPYLVRGLSFDFPPVLPKRTFQASGIETEGSNPIFKCRTGYSAPDSPYPMAGIESHGLGVDVPPEVRLELDWHGRPYSYGRRWHYRAPFPSRVLSPPSQDGSDPIYAAQVAHAAGTLGGAGAGPERPQPAGRGRWSSAPSSHRTPRAACRTDTSE